MTWQDAAAWAHILAATSGLLLGAVVLVRRKGTASHRRIGAGYAVALLLVNVAALFVHRNATFGVFHWLALLSLVTLALGLLPMLAGRRTRAVIDVHAFSMSGSYAGLAAAGVGQLAAGFGPGSAATVPLVIGLVLGLCAGAIAWRVPVALRGVSVAGERSA
jgi:uncharacterized membrane protein